MPLSCTAWGCCASNVAVSDHHCMAWLASILFSTCTAGLQGLGLTSFSQTLNIPSPFNDTSTRQRIESNDLIDPTGQPGRL